MFVRYSMRTCCLAFGVMLALAPMLTAEAGEVTLRVKGGGLEVSGELKSFDGVSYIIEAPAVGTMTFDATRFECIGENCTRRVSVPVLPAERLSAEAPDRFSVRGSTPINRGLMPAFIRGYAASLGASATQIIGLSPEETKFRIADASGAELATIMVQTGDAGSAFSALEQGRASIGTSDRPISDAEAQQMSRLSPDMHSARNEFVVGHDGLVIIVSPENPAASMSEDSAGKIFSGQITNWTEAGIPGGRIAIYSSGHRSSADDVLISAILKPRGLTRAAGVKELASEADVADAVSRDPNGIGIVSFAFQRSAKRLNLEGACGLITRPSAFAVKAGEYALNRRLFFYTSGVLNQPAARGLLRYALSRDAQPALSDQDFVDERIELLPFDDQTERMAFALNAPAQGFDMDEMRKLLADLKGAKRLSLTFRFTSGSFDLAPVSRLDVLRLAEFMQGAEVAGKTAILIGFTDAEGKFGPNAAISARRANQVRSAVLAAAGGKISATALIAKGYGPLAPIACNDTLERRQLNRRVEVWIK